MALVCGHASKIPQSDEFTTSLAKSCISCVARTYVCMPKISELSPNQKFIPIKTVLLLLSAQGLLISTSADRSLAFGKGLIDVLPGLRTRDICAHILPEPTPTSPTLLPICFTFFYLWKKQSKCKVIIFF